MKGQVFGFCANLLLEASDRYASENTKGEAAAAPFAAPAATGLLNAKSVRIASRSCFESALHAKNSTEQVASPGWLSYSAQTVRTAGVSGAEAGCHGMHTNSDTAHVPANPPVVHRPVAVSFGAPLTAAQFTPSDAPSPPPPPPSSPSSLTSSGCIESTDATLAYKRPAPAACNQMLRNRVVNAPLTTRPPRSPTAGRNASVHTSGAECMSVLRITGIKPLSGPKVTSDTVTPLCRYSTPMVNLQLGSRRNPPRTFAETLVPAPIAAPITAKSSPTGPIT